MNQGVSITTGLPFLDELSPLVESFLRADVLEMNLDGGT